jgi:hypothetical protein
MKSEVLTAVKMSTLSFWVVTPCGLVCRYQRFGATYCLHLQGWSHFSVFSPEDGDSMLLRNVGIYIRVRTASQPRRTTSTRNFSICGTQWFFIVFIWVRHWSLSEQDESSPHSHHISLRSIQIFFLQREYLKLYTVFFLCFPHFRATTLFYNRGPE